MPTTTPKTSAPLVSWKGDHAAIRVPDFDAAVTWYSEKLGFRLIRSWVIRDKKYGYVSPVADERFAIELIGGSGAEPRPTYEDLGTSLNVAGWHHVCFQVESVDDSITELKRRGVTVVSEPHDVAALGRRVAFFADCWGNLFEVVREIES